MQIDLINTGGTIGSTLQHEAMTVADGSSNLNLILTRLCQQYECQLQEYSPWQKNSEDVQLIDWHALLSCLISANNSTSDAILVTHGTDSMAYSLALAACFNHLWRKPICFSGAFISPELEHSDAYNNLEAAFDYLHQSQDHEVHLAFELDQQVHILPAAWVLPMRAWDRYFHCAYQQSRASKNPGEKFQLQTHSSLAHPQLSHSIQTLASIEDLNLSHQRIASFSYTPGMDLRPLLGAYQHHDLIIIELLHSGTASFSGDNSLLHFIEQLDGQVILTALPSQLISQPYQSSLKLKQSGAWLLKDLPYHYIFCFCLLHLAHNKQKDLMQLKQDLQAWLY